MPDNFDWLVGLARLLRVRSKSSDDPDAPSPVPSPPPVKSVDEVSDEPKVVTHSLDLIDEAFGRLTAPDEGDESEGQDDSDDPRGIDDLDAPTGPMVLELPDEAFIGSARGSARKGKVPLLDRYLKAKADFAAANERFSDQLNPDDRELMKNRMADVMKAVGVMDWQRAAQKLTAAKITLERLYKQRMSGEEPPRIADVDTLVEAMGGPPRDDRTLGGVTLQKRDTAYKATLDALRVYEQAVTELGGRKLGSSNATDGLNELKTKALAVAHAAQDTIEALDGDDDSPQALVMGEARDRATREGLLIDAVLADTRFFTDGAALTLEQVIRLKGDETTPEKLAQELKAQHDRMVEERKRRAEEAERLERERKEREKAPKSDEGDDEGDEDGDDEGDEGDESSD